MALANNTHKETELAAWQWVPRFLVWLGTSAGALGVVFSVFGFLVEHAWFDRLGVPRSLYEATANEYLVTGGKFLLGTFPLGLLGAVQFVVNYSWLALGSFLAGSLAWWFRSSSALRWLLATVLLALSLSVVALRFERATTADYTGLAMFTFVVVVGMSFAYLEIYFERETRNEEQSESLLSRYATRAPFFLFLLCALTALPYLRGYYALDRDYPIVQFLGKDKKFFCELVGNSSASELSIPCDQELWQVIDIGQQRALLRRLADARIYVVPASVLTTFSIRGKEEKR
jgi:hypothetical protein